MGLITKVLSFLTGSLVGEIGGIAKAYFNKEISEAEFEAKIKIAVEENHAKIEQAWADTTAKTTESVQQTMRVSPMMQRAYALALLSQIFVLIWYQVGASAFLLYTGKAWPSPGTTVEWAYLLVGAMIGAGPLVFKR